MLSPSLLKSMVLFVLASLVNPLLLVPVTAVFAPGSMLSRPKEGALSDSDRRATSQLLAASKSVPKTAASMRLDTNHVDFLEAVHRYERLDADQQQYLNDNARSHGFCGPGETAPSSGRVYGQAAPSSGSVSAQAVAQRSANPNSRSMTGWGTSGAKAKAAPGGGLFFETDGLSVRMRHQPRTEDTRMPPPQEITFTPRTTPLTGRTEESQVQQEADAEPLPARHNIFAEVYAEEQGLPVPEPQYFREDSTVFNPVSRRRWRTAFRCPGRRVDESMSEAELAIRFSRTRRGERGGGPVGARSESYPTNDTTSRSSGVINVFETFEGQRSLPSTDGAQEGEAGARGPEEVGGIRSFLARMPRILPSAALSSEPVERGSHEVNIDLSSQHVSFQHDVGRGMLDDMPARPGGSRTIEGPAYGTATTGARGVGSSNAGLRIASHAGLETTPIPRPGATGVVPAPGVGVTSARMAGYEPRRAREQRSNGGGGARDREESWFSRTWRQATDRARREARSRSQRTRGYEGEDERP